MKKSKLLILGLIGLLIVLGVIFFGCNRYDKCDGKCNYTPSDSGSKNILICNNHFDAIGYDKCYRECAAGQALAGDYYFSASCNCK